MQHINKLASLAIIVQPIQLTTYCDRSISFNWATSGILYRESSKQPNITSTEPSNLLIKELGLMNSIEFGFKMGHSTGLTELLCP